MGEIALSKLSLTKLTGRALIYKLATQDTLAKEDGVLDYTARQHHTTRPEHKIIPTVEPRMRILSAHLEMPLIVVLAIGETSLVPPLHHSPSRPDAGLPPAPY
eukprot:193374-Pyramimonas_sp.AAC.1